MVSRRTGECILAVLKITLASSQQFLAEERECGKFIRSYQEIPYFSINALCLSSEEGENYSSQLFKSINPSLSLFSLLFL